MNNKKIWLIMLFGPFLTSSQDLNFNLDIDNLMKPFIGDISKAKEHIKNLKEMAMVSGLQTTSTVKYDPDYDSLNIEENNMTTIEPNDFVATRADFMPQFHLMSTLRPDINKNPNLTLSDLAERLRAIEVVKMVEQDSSIVPKFDQHEDDPGVITRRFDELKVNEREKSLRIHYYWHHFNYFLTSHYRAEKVRLVQIMLQFIYMARYKMEYPQRLRGKYLHSERYKIGYCFGLLRQLQREQMILFSTYRRNQYLIWAIHFHIKIYEKIVRLDIDIKDVIALIRRYNFDKNMIRADLYQSHSIYYND